jgi:hypothetical protein
VADFVHQPAKLIVEIDGYYHTLPDQAERDAARTAWLKGRGYRVVRFDEARVRNDVAAVLEEILALAPFPLQGGKAGIGGETLNGADKSTGGALSDLPDRSTETPPTPTLPPSRGKGERLIGSVG